MLHSSSLATFRMMFVSQFEGFLFIKFTHLQISFVNKVGQLTILFSDFHFIRFVSSAIINMCTIDVRGPYVTPELNNELQCNVGNMWEKSTLYLHALRSTSKVYYVKKEFPEIMTS